MKAMQNSAPTFYPTLRYHDASAAIAWLERAFGFAPQLVVPGPNGSVAHAQLTFGNGIVMLGSVKDDALGERPGAIYVYLEDVDAHCTRARAAGALIVREPQDTEYGSREYGAQDPEGNQWYFGTYRPSVPET